MRTKDENKIKAIKHAVIKLAQADGFTNLTTAKVAKEAGVSPATIYLYYQDKTDMLSRLYEEVKDDMHRGLAGVIAAAGADTTAQVRAMLEFSVQQVVDYPQEAHFMNALWTNQELLDDKARAYGSIQAGPLLKLYATINADPQFVDAPEQVLAAFGALPTLMLETSGDRVDSATMDLVIELVLKALKK